VTRAQAVEDDIIPGFPNSPQGEDDDGPCSLEQAGGNTSGSRLKPRRESLIRAWQTGLQAKFRQGMEPDLLGKRALQQEMAN
jgi:hypothetical protein